MLNNQKILPIFSTQGSVGKSILTSEDEIEISNDSPTSILAIAKKENLEEIVVIDNSFLDFVKLYKGTSKYKIKLLFGINFTICNDVKDKTDKSLFTNSKVSVLMKNSKGYTDLIKLNDAINANVENFYYEPRGDWEILKKYYTENLEILIPSYDNFIHKNLLQNGKCIPDFGKIKPIMCYSNMELPFDEILTNGIKRYSENNKLKSIETHPIYYYNYSDFKSYMIFRTIQERSQFSKPDVEFLCSNNFCWEGFKNKI